MKKGNGVHVLYKNVGETPLSCIERFKKDNPEYVDVPMTYAGRLDPMAEGLLLVLSGEEVKHKDKYIGLPKTYEFEVLWGFKTDTLDVLGIISENSFSSNLSRSTHNFWARNLLILAPTRSESLRSRLESTNFPSGNVPLVELIQKFSAKSVGKFEQKYPAYSSKPVSGPTPSGRASKPLFEWAREGKLGEIEIPSHEVEIFDSNFISRREISKNDLLQNITAKINLVSGDFRQAEIKHCWQEVMSRTVLDTFMVDKISITVSSGFYVRQFVSDLADCLGTKAATFHIKRTHVGEYAVENSV